VGAFFNKVDGDGRFIFNRAVDGPGFDEARAVTMVSNDNFISAGVLEGTFDFNSASGTLMVTSQGGIDAFVAKFSKFGFPIWAATAGGEGYDYANDVTSYRGAVTLVGGFESTADFDPEPDAVQSRTSNGNYDLFVQRLIQLNPTAASPGGPKPIGASLFSTRTQILDEEMTVLK